jgi:hypothetical protein
MIDGPAIKVVARAVRLVLRSWATLGPVGEP